MSKLTTLHGRAVHLHRHLGKFIPFLGDEYRSLKAQVASLVRTIEEEFDVAQSGRRKGKSSQVKKRTTEQLRRSLRHQMSKVRNQKRHQQRELGSDRENGKLHALWMVRTMLAAPEIPQRTLASFCCEFSLVEDRSISHTSIASVKDAFGEILKRLNAQKAKALFQAVDSKLGRDSTQAPRLTIIHIHDGADLRLRSWSDALRSDADMQMPANARVLSRARTSKIQNHHITLKFDDRILGLFQAYTL